MAKVGKKRKHTGRRKKGKKKRRNMGKRRKNRVK